jgi:predicted TIM-barrel enzyme
VDAILISGLWRRKAGFSCSASKRTHWKDKSLFLNTGAKLNNIEQFLSVADGVIVGSSLKVDGYTWNPVDPKRVRAFMDKVREIREK